MEGFLLLGMVDSICDYFLGVLCMVMDVRIDLMVNLWVLLVVGHVISSSIGGFIGMEIAGYVWMSTFVGWSSLDGGYEGVAWNLGPFIGVGCSMFWQVIFLNGLEHSSANEVCLNFNYVWDYLVMGIKGLTKPWTYLLGLCGMQGLISLAFVECKSNFGIVIWMGFCWESNLVWM